MPRCGKIRRVIRRFLTAAVVIPAYAFATTVFVIFLLVLGAIVTKRAVDALRGHGPTYSRALTQRCLEGSGRSVRHHPGGPVVGPDTLDVKPYRRAGITSGTTLYFLETADQAAKAEFSDSERIRRRGNVLFPEFVAGAKLPDPAIDECLDQAREAE